MSDYYPFGLAMPGRTVSADEYRYGFNGKEKDPEGLGGGGTTYDYGFRIYNPGIAKFLSVDPISAKYPMLTPYQFASNIPILYVDIDGLEGGLDIRTRIMEEGYLKGTVTEQELKQFYYGNGIAGLMGLSIVLTRGAILRYSPQMLRAIISLNPQITGSAAAIGGWLQNPRNQQLIAEGGAFVAGVIDQNPAAQYSAGYGDELGNFVGGIFRTGGKAALNYIFRSPVGDEFTVGSAKLVDGLLSFKINATDKLLGSGVGKHIFQDALNQFGNEVKGIEAVWGVSSKYPGNKSKGLQEFWEELNYFEGVYDDFWKAAEKAASNTTLGKMAKERGFTKIVVDRVDHDEVIVNFLKE